MLFALLLAVYCSLSWAQEDATATTEYITPTPPLYGDHHRLELFEGGRDLMEIQDEIRDIEIHIN